MVEAGNASDAAGDAAKARREARKARILGAGTDRLARITKTGRGGEAELLYADKPKSLGGQSGSESRDPLDGAPERDDDPLIERAAAAKSETDDPDDIDISQPSGSMMAQQQQQMPSFFGGNGQDMPQDLQGMIQAMQQAMGAGGRPGPGAPGAGPDMNFPFPPGMGLGMGAPPSQQPAEQASGSHIVDRIFNLLRVFVFVGFGFALVYNAIKTGPALAEHVVPEGDTGIVEKFEHMSTLHRWARLGYERPAHWEARHFDPESFGLPIHGIVSLSLASISLPLIVTDSDFSLSSLARLLALHHAGARPTELSHHVAKGEYTLFLI